MGEKLNYTPGPWAWDEKRNQVRQVNFPKDEDGDDTFERIVETDGGFYPPFGDDAKLIAMAPELYEENERLKIELEQIQIERDEANLRLIKSAVCLNNPCYDLMKKQQNQKCRYWDDCASNNWMKICGPVPPGFRPEAKE